jgi:hypothetical protein
MRWHAPIRAGRRSGAASRLRQAHAATTPNFTPWENGAAQDTANAWWVDPPRHETACARSVFFWVLRTPYIHVMARPQRRRYLRCAAGRLGAARAMSFS